MKCSKSCLFDLDTKCSGFVVSRFGFHTYEFIFFDDVSREVVAVNTTGIQPDRILSAPRLGRRPVTEEHSLLAVIDVIPRRSLVTLAIRAEGADARHVARSEEHTSELQS